MAENYYSLDLLGDIGLKFRDNFPYILSDIDFTTINNKRTELVIPKDPLNEAVYLLFFRSGKRKLRYSRLFRVTDSGQSFMGLMEHPEVNQIMHELREVYDKRKHKKEGIKISVPERGGDKWYSTENPTYEGSKTLDVYLIQPTDKFNLAEEFEKVFKKHDVISVLEEKGKKDLEQNVSRTIVELETF